MPSEGQRYARSDNVLEEDPFHLARHPIAKEEGVFVRAYEATLICTPNDESLHSSARRRSVRWQGEDGTRQSAVSIETDEYDILHSLSHLPSGGTLTKGQRPVELTPASPVESSTSNVPSDVEDMFFMDDEEEVHAFQRAKKQRRLEELRSARVAALREREEAEDLAEAAQVPSGQDEETITQAQWDLMRKTAQAIRTAANPSMLEMRILANHAHDARFAFLRASTKPGSSRMAMAWTSLKEGQMLTLEEANGGKGSNKGIAGLNAYGSSDEEEGDEVEAMREVNETGVDGEDARQTEKKRKLALAREWSRKRQARLQLQRQEQSQGCDSKGEEGQ